MIRARRGEDAYTLTEVMITVAILGIVMLPLLAWMLVAMERSRDTRANEESADFAMVARTFIRDVQGATSVEPAFPICERTGRPLPLIDTGEESPLDPRQQYTSDGAVVLTLMSREVVDPSTSTSVMTVTQYLTRPTLHKDADTEVGTLWRRKCTYLDSGAKVSDSRLASLLTVPGSPGTIPADPADYAQVDCDSIAPGDADGVAKCEVVELKVKPSDRKAVQLSATRRADDSVVENDKRPRPVIECTPSCTGYRADAMAYRVVLDSSKSRNVTHRLWSFGDGSPTSDLESPAHDFQCFSGSANWNAAAKECRFQVTLTVIGGEPLRAARASTTVVVKNSSPVIVLDDPNPPRIENFRLASVNFRADRSADADDDDLLFRWDFGDGTVESGLASQGYAVRSHKFRSEIAAAPPAFVTLTVTDDDGVSATQAIPIAISNHPPTANFTASKTIITLCPTGTPAAECDDRQVKFDSTWIDGNPPKGAFDPDGAPAGDPVRTGPSPVTSREWMIVRRNQDGSETPINYTTECPPGGIPPCTSPGFQNSIVAGGRAAETLTLKFPNQIAVYDITLRVTDAEGLVNTSRIRLTANAQPRSIIDILDPANGGTTLKGQSDGERFTFTGERSFDPDYDSVAANGQPPIRQYSWSVTRVSGRDACTLPSQVGTNPVFIPDLCPGRYVVRLVVQDQFGADSPRVDGRILAIPARTQVEVKVNERPTVSMQQNIPGMVQRNVPFTFTPVVKDSYTDGGVERVIAPGDTVAQHIWSHRAGSGAWQVLPAETGPTMTMSFGAIGSNSVRLRAIDNDGAYTEREMTFSVVPARPVAAFAVQPNEIGPMNTGFNFVNSSYDPDGTVVSCLWTIERESGTATHDGCTLPSQSWSAPGTYDVSLQVWDNDVPQLTSLVFTRTITVLQPIEVTVTMSSGSLSHNPVDGPWLVKDPTNVLFTATVNDPNPGATIAGREWVFGNGRPNASNTYAPGAVMYQRVGNTREFHGSFTVSNSLGLVTTVPFTIGVNQIPVAVLGETRPAPGAPPIAVNANCPPASGVADSALANAYSVVGCRLVESITTAPFAYNPSDPSSHLNARASYDPDGGPGFSEALLRNLSPPGASSVCWYESGIAPQYLNFCHAPTANLQAGSIVLNGPQTTPRSRSTYTIVVRVTDAVGSPPSDGVPFTVYLNMRPYGVRIDGPNAATSAATLQLRPNVETNATNLSSPARDGDAEVPLRFHWRFTAAGNTTPLAVCGVAGDQPCEEVVTSGRNYPKVILPPGASGVVRLTVTDERGYAVEAPPRDFTVPIGKPVARITVTSSNASRFLADVQRLVLDTPSNALNSALTASLSGSTSTNSSGGAALDGYSWQITRESVTGSPVAETATGVNLNGRTFSNSSTVAGQVTGTWRVTLTVTEGGQTDSTSIVVRLNVPPTPAAVCPNPIKYSTVIPATFQFTNGSADLHDNPTSPSSSMRMSWVWGDGTQLTDVPWSASVPHTYNAFSTQTFDASGTQAARRVPISFTLKDEDGATAATINCTNHVRVNREPEITAAVDRPTIRQAGFSGRVNFTSDATDGDYSPNGVATGYLPASAFTWHFRSTGANGSPTCSATMGSPVAGASSQTGVKNATFDILDSTPGNYWGVLVVTDPGANGSLLRCVRVRVNAAPTAQIAASVPGIDGYTDLFFGSWVGRRISGAPSTDDAGIATYYWQFFDECDREVRPPNAPLDSRKAATTAMTDVMVTKEIPGSCGLNDPNARGKIRLTVTDTDGDTAFVEHPLSAQNGNPVAVIAPLSPNWIANDARLTVDGSGSNDSGPIQFWRWTVTNTANGQVVHTSGDRTTPTYQLPLLPWGTYQVSLVVVDADGLDSTMNVNAQPPEPVPPPTRNFTVRQRPTAVITSDPDDTVFTGDLLQRVSFFGGDSRDEDASPPHSGLTYHWDIYDDMDVLETTWDERDFLDVDFIGSGTHRVVLTVTDGTNLVGTAEKTVVLNARPQVVVAANPLVANPPGVGSRIAFTFNPTGTNDPDGTIVSCDWRFLLPNGDVDTGAPDNGVQSPSTNCNTTTVTHQFPATPGTYSAEVKVTDNRGATTTRVVTVRVNAKPVAAHEGGTLTIERNVAETLDGSASSDSDSQSGTWPTGIKDYFWEFIRDGQTTPFFTTRTSSSTTSVQLPANVPAPQNGLLRLTVTDADDRVSDSVTRPYTLTGAAPIASVSVDPSALVLEPGEARTFRHANSSDPDSTTLSNFRWEFFANGSSTPYRTVNTADPNATVLEVFALAGRYEVRLTVTDQDNMTGTESVTIKANVAPTAGIDLSGAPLTAQVDVPRSFDGGPPHSTDPDADDPQDPIGSYLWTFRDPDGQLYGSADGPNPSVSFDRPGTFTVQLVVFDHDGFASASTPSYSIQVTAS